MGLKEEILAETKARIATIKIEKYAGSRPVFDVAMERGDLDLAALCFAVGAVETLQNYPRETLEALLDEIDAEFPPHRGSRSREKKEHHGRRHR